MTWRGAALTVGVVTAIGVAVGAALYATDSLPIELESADGHSPTATPSPSPLPAWEEASAVLDAARNSTSADISAALEDELDAAGGQLGARVVNVVSGEVVHSDNDDAAYTPASTLKLLTAAAVLSRLGSDHTFETAVLLAPGDEPSITLVGGGDPLLRTDDAIGSTSLADLAVRTSRALEEADIEEVGLTYDDSLFSGPAVDSDWESTYVSDGIVSPVSALAIDGGRTSPDGWTRSADPAAAAAQEFADLLHEDGIAVIGAPQREPASETAEPMAKVTSAPLSAIVEYLMATSDNDVAEVLGRHVAVASGRPGTADESTIAIVETLRELGIELESAAVLDGSGLSRANSVPATAIVDVLVLAASENHPDLRSIITGLPVAGFTGTLTDRFGDGGEGVVRAKTGTLTQGGVHSLAGIATTPDGGAYVFAFVANGVDVDAALSTRDALDAAAAVLSEATT